MKPLAPETRATVTTALRAGRPYAEICAEHGISKNCVSKIAIKAGLRRKQRPPMLSGEAAALVTERYQAGEAANAIAGSFGISPDLVWETLRRCGVQARDASAAHIRLPLNHAALDVLTPEAAYWCGILFTDGTVTRQQHRSPEVAVVLQRGDREHLVKLRAFLGSGHAITSIAPARVRLNGGMGTGAFRFAVRSRPLADRALALGRYGGPVSPELSASRDFWRGCVDGDGTVSVSRGVPQLKLIGSQWLLQAFVDFLGPVGRRPLNVRPARSIFVVSVSGRTAEKVIARLYAGAPVGLDRKMEAAAAIIARTAA